MGSSQTMNEQKKIAENTLLDVGLSIQHIVIVIVRDPLFTEGHVWFTMSPFKPLTVCHFS